MTREDGSIAVTWMMPEKITAEGKTLSVTFVDGVNKSLTAQNDEGEKTFPLPSSDVRTYEADSIPGAVLTFHDIQDTIATYPDPIVAYEKITVDQIPDSRTYRDAWSVSGKSITINMTKAREVRKPMLETLDIAYQRADEQDDGPLKRRIAAEKQKLRDITSNPLIEQATTTAMLDVLTVEYLLAHP
jgi:hypothetical protein